MVIWLFEKPYKNNGFRTISKGLRSLLETLYFIRFFEGFPEPSENHLKTNGFSLVLGRSPMPRGMQNVQKTLEG